MKLPPKNERRMAGFSLLELLTTIVVITILAALLLPVLASTKERGRRTICKSNLHQIGVAFDLYADENRQLLPDCTSNNPPFFGSYWPWDLNTNVVSMLVAHGVARDVLYCPSNPNMNSEHRWDFWKYHPPAPIRVLGYVFLVNGCVQVPTDLWRTNILGDGTHAPANTELVIDAVGKQGQSFTDLQGGNTDRTSHLDGQIPAGGNIAFEDGHSAWRNFRDMRPRFAGNVVWYY